MWDSLNNLLDADLNRFHDLARSKYRETACSANKRHHSKFQRMTNSMWPNKEFRDTLIINRSTVEFNDSERDILALTLNLLFLQPERRQLTLSHVSKMVCELYPMKMPIVQFELAPLLCVNALEPRQSTNIFHNQSNVSAKN